MSAPHHALSQSYQPVTFVERGVAVPFTTPALNGARARPAERGSGAELIVPNPSGARGVYVIPWSGVRQLCRPTVHDERLNQRVALLASVTPVTLRAAVRAVAAEGLGGQAATAAAAAADAADQRERLVANYMLLLALLQQTEPEAAPRASPRASAGEAPTAELERRARLVAVRIVPRLNRPGAVPEDVGRALDGLAGLYAGIGVGAGAADARLAGIVERLAAMRDSVRAWATSDTDDMQAMASAIGGVIGTTLACAAVALTAARARVADMVCLVRDWLAAPAKLAGLVERPDWLLDGWSGLIGIWEGATDDAARRAALAELLVIAPTLPKEASTWLDLPVDNDALLRVRRTVKLNEDWRTGAVSAMDRVVRNERLLAHAV